MSSFGIASRRSHPILPILGTLNRYPVQTAHLTTGLNAVSHFLPFYAAHRADSAPSTSGTRIAARFWAAPPAAPREPSGSSFADYGRPGKSRGADVRLVDGFETRSGHYRWNNNTQVAVLVTFETFELVFALCMSRQGRARRRPAAWVTRRSSATSSLTRAASVGPPPLTTAVIADLSAAGYDRGRVGLPSSWG